MTIEQRRSWTGRIFILPWVLGFILFFAKPFIQSFIFTFQKVKLAAGTFESEFVGLENYKFLILVDKDYLPSMFSSVGKMLTEVLIVLMFSLFLACILKEDFHGRTISRAILFLPVIIASGVIIQLLKQDILSASTDPEESGLLFQVSAFKDFLVERGWYESAATRITEWLGNLFELLWKCGVQILVFLAGLHSIPPDLYEVCAIEGATKWETFWKVTFPMLTPIILINIIYTIIDYFIDFGNPVMQTIEAESKDLNFHMCATMSWFYFVLIFIIIMIIIKALSKKVFYMVE